MSILDLNQELQTLVFLELFQKLDDKIWVLGSHLLLPRTVLSIGLVPTSV